MLILGLTGSIGMGKSTIAQMFRDLTVWVFDADAAVHALYEDSLVEPIGRAFPSAVINNRVDRVRLSRAIADDHAAFTKLEQLVHPFVIEKEQTFLRRARQANRPLVVLDIPLLFETGAHKRVDKILTITAPFAIQAKRVLARDGMTPDKFRHILDRQMTDAEKKKMADFVIDSSKGYTAARQSVKEICKRLIHHANCTPS